jgi:crotonobetainyl-CoA:carnitine CoA-transferase CaiB-like acyl-CoA transferase
MDEQGMAEDLTDPMYFVPELFREHAGHISEVLGRFIATMSADEFFHGGQRRGLIVCDINYPEDLVPDEHLAARGFWRDIELADGSHGLFAASTFLCSESETGPWRRAPLLDEHGESLAREFGFSRG